MSTLIEKILTFVSQSAITTVSFDVFDTLVFRRLSDPTEVFSRAYLHCKEELQMIQEANEFQEMRVFAEKSAKRQVESGEVTLDEIYAHFSFTETQRNTLKQAELCVEKQYCFVYEPMLALIQELKIRRIKILFISDMYLSANQIRALFFADYPILLDCPLYVSCEFRRNKQSGSLFEYLTELHQFDKKSWLHIGDNQKSDVLVPQKLGLQTLSVYPELDVNLLFSLERRLSSASTDFNAARLIAGAHFKSSEQAIAHNIGAVVWGPVLHAFADWVIDQSIKVQSTTILCLMREAVVFTPLITLRLKQRDITNVSVIDFYASRKSTFWAAIDLSDKSWFDELIYILVHRRGYTVDDFYRDFFLPADAVKQQYGKIKLRDADGVFSHGESLLKKITLIAKDNKVAIAEYIENQKSLFKRYFAHSVGCSLSDCIIVDLGGGGTIPHQIEMILGQKSAANLLFYTSERIYRFIDKSEFSGFLNAHNDTRNLRQLVSRSAECIEPFLVGHSGSTLGYEDDEVGTPIMAAGIMENSLIVDAFLDGALAYFTTHHQVGFKRIKVEQIVPVLFRYIQMPSIQEAGLLQSLYHQDNFGSNDIYPIITSEQLNQIEQYGVHNFYLKFCNNVAYQTGVVHWPQAAITLLDASFMRRINGVAPSDIFADVNELVERILAYGWERFSVYGAGEFFEALLPHLIENNLKIEHLIDRKAEISGPYDVAGFPVISLDESLSLGCEKIVISSFAFKNEIAKNIYAKSLDHSRPLVEVLSL